MLEKIDSRFDAIDSKLDNHDELLAKLTAHLIEMESYMRENMTTKKELKELKEVEDRITTHIDGFIQMHTKIDVEQAALLGKYHRHEERITVVENQLGIAAI